LDEGSGTTNTTTANSTTITTTSTNVTTPIIWKAPSHRRVHCGGVLLFPPVLLCDECLLLLAPLLLLLSLLLLLLSVLILRPSFAFLVPLPRLLALLALTACDSQGHGNLMSLRMNSKYYGANWTSLLHLVFQ
jgi:hypothetical protein